MSEASKQGRCRAKQTMRTPRLESMGVGNQGSGWGIGVECLKARFWGSDRRFGLRFDGREKAMAGLRLKTLNR